SGNVICLDVLRAARREPAALEALWDELEQARGGHRDLDHSAEALRSRLRETDEDQASARHVAQAIAVLLSASLLVRHAPAAIGDAYCATRLRGDAAFAGAAFGGHGIAFDPALPLRRARGDAPPETPAGT